MKKIRMIKENDLFEYEEGDIWYDDDGMYCPYISFKKLVELGYAEWVEEDGKYNPPFTAPNSTQLEEEPEKIEEIEFYDKKAYRTAFDIVDKLNDVIEAVNKLREDLDKLNKGK